MQKLSPQEAYQALQEGALLIDVREADEVAAQRYEVTHLHIPQAELSIQTEQLPKDKLLVMACLGGWRSANAALLLEQHGFQTANLEGGYIAWKQAGLPTWEDSHIEAGPCACGCETEGATNQAQSQSCCGSAKTVTPQATSCCDSTTTVTAQGTSCCGPATRAS